MSIHVEFTTAGLEIFHDWRLVISSPLRSSVIERLSLAQQVYLVRSSESFLPSPAIEVYKNQTLQLFTEIPRV